MLTDPIQPLTEAEIINECEREANAIESGVSAFNITTANVVKLIRSYVQAARENAELRTELENERVESRDWSVAYADEYKKTEALLCENAGLRDKVVARVEKIEVKTCDQCQVCGHDLHSPCASKNIRLWLQNLSGSKRESHTIDLIAGVEHKIATLTTERDADQLELSRSNARYMQSHKLAEALLKERDAAFARVAKLLRHNAKLKNDLSAASNEISNLSMLATNIERRAEEAETRLAMALAPTSQETPQ